MYCLFDRALYRLVQWWWVPFRKSTKIKSGKRAQDTIVWFLLKAGIYVFLWAMTSRTYFLRELISFIDKSHGFFFYQGFLSLTLTNHRTAGEREGIIFYFTIPLPPTHRDFLYILPNYRPVFWSTESFQNCIKDTSTSCLLRYWVFVFKKKSLRPRAKFQ